MEAGFTFLTYIAMALDTLPDEGRVVLFLVLLGLALFGLAKSRIVTQDNRVAGLFFRGVFVVLLVLPTLMYITSIRMPVYEIHGQQFYTQAPTYLTYFLLACWYIGAAYYLFRYVQQWRLISHQLSDDKQAASNLADDKTNKRLAHWSKRLGLQEDVMLRIDGGEAPWHFAASWRGGYVIVLPASALSWPRGVLDVALLIELSKIVKSGWVWLIWSRFVCALLWPLRWLPKMADQLSETNNKNCLGTAESAYRDNYGWQKDLRQLIQRLESLTPVPTEALRLPSFTPDVLRADQNLVDDAADFEAKLNYTKAKLKQKHHDPYEKAYWLLACACVFVGVMSTLTIVKTPPEFEPKFLNIKWQDQMVRKLKDYDEEQESSSTPAAASEE